MARVYKLVNQAGELLGYGFDCPGCRMVHTPYTVRHGDKPVWEFNGNVDLPTFSPSILVRWQHGEQREERRCHSFVRYGRIEFLSDCTHSLKGQTVDLPEVREG